MGSAVENTQLLALWWQCVVGRSQAAALTAMASLAKTTMMSLFSLLGLPWEGQIGVHALHNLDFCVARWPTSITNRGDAESAVQNLVRESKVQADQS